MTRSNALPALGRVLDVELSQPLPTIPAPDGESPGADAAWVVARLLTEPLGLVRIPIGTEGVSRERLAAELWTEVGGAVAARALAVGVTVRSIPCDGIRWSGTSLYLEGRERALRSASLISVVVCTRNRPESLRRCLASLLSQSHPRFEVVVVDNAPREDNAAAVRELTGLVPIRYVVEPIPGLSRARNRGTEVVEGDLIAMIDDDEVADRDWLAEVARVFHVAPETLAMSGSILPPELCTKPQEWFEQFGGHGKGRGLQPAVFGPSSRSRQSPLSPLPPFGCGGNMVMRREGIELIRGFDVALGSGTPAMAGEDTLAFTKILLGGGTVIYHPPALVWHYHHRDYRSTLQQFYGYGRGLTAFYTSLILDDPRRLIELVRLAPQALAAMYDTDGTRLAGVPEEFPRELLRAQRRGMLRGPLAYLQARHTARAIRRRLG